MKIILKHRISVILILLSSVPFLDTDAQTIEKPNVIIINTDDLGYGDLSAYGATEIKTPHIDALAENGIRFTNGHATSATCTPSRYALLTGEYPWRRDTKILPGDAALIIPTDKTTVPSLFQKAGYATGIVGKWHLGLGKTLEKDWNKPITPGPNEVGFDYSFIFPATADRVPTVFMENGLVLGLEADDLIGVNYKEAIGNDPTGISNPELLKMRASPNHGHNNTIVNGIGRIGYMTGGQKARWTDEEVPITFLVKAKDFIQKNKNKPFFLYYALTEPHVPRMPSTIFKGKSKLGYRGDAILQIDWAVGEITKQLKALGIEKNTIIIFTSDNGPVLNDGYVDYAVEMNGKHRPAGPLRGGKYSAFEGGSRVPFIISWPGNIEASISDALVCQVDFLRSFAHLIKQPLSEEQGQDSQNTLSAFLGQSKQGRDILIKQGGALSVTKGRWKYITPNPGVAVAKLTNIETGNSKEDQLYNLKEDLSEQNNVAKQHSEKVAELKQILSQTTSP
ncbi:sulfatase family protein [Albibacterium profundi]|uniref:Arylsulfatase n=1 Tax=Albibacterium profundi TaxID=3134906 RepID=A0ABV5CCI4_9SPHI